MTTQARPTLESLEERTVPSTVVGTYSDGVWSYDTTLGWGHLTDRSASQLAVDDSRSVYGAFTEGRPSDGLWLWISSVGAWQKLSESVPQAFDVTARGILYADYGSGGVWRWSPAGGWEVLSVSDPGVFTVSDSDAFFGSFNSGTWRWSPAQGWALLSYGSTSQLLSDAAGAVVGVYGGQVWRWSPATGWANLNSPPVSSLGITLLDVSANGTIFSADPGVVLRFYRYDPATPEAGWQSVETGGPAGRTGPVAAGVADSQGGLVYLLTYAPAAPLNFDRVTSATYYPAGSTGDSRSLWVAGDSQGVVVVAGKDGDYFFSTSGLLYHWSEATSFQLLSYRSASVLASQR